MCLNIKSGRNNGFFFLVAKALQPSKHLGGVKCRDIDIELHFFQDLRHNQLSSPVVMDNCPTFPFHVSPQKKRRCRRDLTDLGLRENGDHPSQLLTREETEREKRTSVTKATQALS